jgi:hypothetical protein
MARIGLIVRKLLADAFNCFHSIFCLCCNSAKGSGVSPDVVVTETGDPMSLSRFVVVDMSLFHCLPVGRCCRIFFLSEERLSAYGSTSQLCVLRIVAQQNLVYDYSDAIGMHSLFGFLCIQKVLLLIVDVTHTRRTPKFLQ